MRPKYVNLDDAKLAIAKRHPEWTQPQKATEFLERWYLALWYLCLVYKTDLYLTDMPVALNEFAVLHKKQADYSSVQDDPQYGTFSVRNKKPPITDRALMNKFKCIRATFYNEHYVACAPRGGGHL